MPIEAVKIPQNVYVEDRIIGPITLKQLVIVGVGSGIGYVLYSAAAEAGASLPVLIATWVPAVIAAAFAFLKINDLSLFNIILLIVESMQKPNQRFWSPHPGLSINVITRQAVHELAAGKAKDAADFGRLAEVTRQMEKRQEEMNDLAVHENPKPENTEAVQTKFATATRPVDAERVGTDGLDPSRSIDSISTHLSTITR